MLVNVDTFNSFTVGWSEPAGVTAQHTPGDTYTLRVTRECLNRQPGSDTFVQSVDYNANLSITTSGQGMHFACIQCSSE